MPHCLALIVLSSLEDEIVEAPDASSRAVGKSPTQYLLHTSGF